MARYLKWDADVLNTSTRLYYSRYIAGLAMTVFEWINLPKELDQRFIEKVLLEQGEIALTYDEAMSQFVALPFTVNGKYDIYGNPVSINLKSVDNGYRLRVDDKERFVIIYNDYNYKGSMTEINLFARRLSDLERTIDVNVFAQKTPTLWACESQIEKLEVENAIKQYGDNRTSIVAKNILSKKVDAITPNVPFKGLELQSLKRQIMAEAYTYFGIPSNADEKAERLITAEVESANGGTTAAQNLRFKIRREKVKEINEKFADRLQGKKIDVKVTSDDENSSEGGNENGEVYDTITDDTGIVE